MDNHLLALAARDLPGALGRLAPTEDFQVLTLANLEDKGVFQEVWVRLQVPAFQVQVARLEAAQAVLVVLEEVLRALATWEAPVSLFLVVLVQEEDFLSSNHHLQEHPLVAGMEILVLDYLGKEGLKLHPWVEALKQAAVGFPGL